MVRFDRKKDSLVGRNLGAGAAFLGGIRADLKKYFFLLNKKFPMASHYYRAIATCSFLKQELEKEQTARKAMVLCFKKIYKSLDLYKGHLINRIRFHMDRHHTEYARSDAVLFMKITIH
jgi:hypothetical protein